MRSRDGVCLAAALAVTSVLFSACGGGGGNHGGTVPRPTNETLIQCGIPIPASLMQTAGTPIDLSNAQAVQHFQIEMIDPATTRITITVDSTTGNADLYIGIPGTPLGDLNNANFYFSSMGTGPTDSITIDQTGCIDGLGIANNTYTLSDFLGGTVDPIFAVASATAGASYDVRIDCLGPPIDSLQCGVSISASLSRMAGTPIDLSNTDAVQHYQIPMIDPSTRSITITVDSTAGNADLHLGMPGTPFGDVNNASYYFSSTELGPTDSITIDDTGCINEFGIASPTFTLSDFLAATNDPVFVVASVTAGASYDVGIVCVGPPPVVDAPCGSTMTFLSIEGLDTFPAIPDLLNYQQNHYYRVTAVPPGAEMITIFSSAAGTGDTNIYLSGPGIAAGSTVISNYVYDSIQPSPFDPYPEDYLTLVPSGITSFFKSSNTPTLVQYLTSGVDIGFVVSGRMLPGQTNPTLYSLSITCFDTPVQTPLTTTCGGSDSGSLMGRFLSPPDYSDPNETVFYEIDMASVPASTTSIVITIQTLLGDNDIYIAAPGTTPGIPAMIFASLHPALDTDQITIDMTGMRSPAGAQGTSTTNWNIDDYLNATTNISFAVHGFDFANDYMLTITCN